MPSPEVIDLTLSDNEIQPDPIRSDQGTSTPTQATNWFRTRFFQPSSLQGSEVDFRTGLRPQ